MIEDKKLYINKNIWPFYLFWICFFPPKLFEAVIPHSKVLFCSLQLIVLVFFALCLKIYGRKVGLSLYELSTICLVVYGGIVCFLYSKDIPGAYFINYVWPIISVMLGIMFLCIYDKRLLTESFRHYFIGLLYLNAISMLFFPHGVIQSSYGASIQRAFWILGSKNLMSKMLPIIFLAISFQFFNSKIVGSISMLLCMLVASSMGSGGVELLSGSTTALVMSAVYFAVMIFLLSKNVNNHFISIVLHPVSILILSGILSLIIYSISQGKISVINNILLFLGKDYTFSYRNTVWKAMVISIKENIWCGIGFKELRLPLANIYTNQCYSFLGAVLLRMGIVGLFLLGVVFYLSYRKCKYTFQVGGTCVALLMLMIYGLMNDFSWECLLVLLGFFSVFKSNTNSN